MAAEDAMNIEGEVIFDEMDVFEHREEIEEQFKFWVKLRLNGRDEYSEQNVKDIVSKFIQRDMISTVEKLTPNLFTMKLRDAGVREYVIRTERITIDDTVVWILPRHNREVRGKICYLPIQIPNDMLRRALIDLGEFIILEQVEQLLFNEYWVKSDVRYFSFRLNPKKTPKDLPYWFLCGEHKGHIRTLSRKPQCNHCKGEGHVKKDCQAYKTKRLKWSKGEPIPGRRVKRGLRYSPKAVPTEEQEHAKVDVSQLQELAVNALYSVRVAQENLNACIDRTAALMLKILKKKKDMQPK